MRILPIRAHCYNILQPCYVQHYLTLSVNGPTEIIITQLAGQEEARPWCYGYLIPYIPPHRQVCRDRSKLVDLGRCLPRNP